MPDQPLDGTETAKAGDDVGLDDWAADLSYREVHLFTEGFFRGFTRRPFGDVKLQGRVVADSWYAKGGYVIGRILQALLVLAGVGGAATFSGVLP
jgi:hypothetical protein